jgi:hypothetical protein
MEFEGEFETHITVKLDRENEIEALQQWSRDRGLKFFHIVLNRGVIASQPMLSRHGWGCLSGELQQARDICHSLNTDGFIATRIKIEAAPNNRDIPQSNSEINNSSHRYFEHHIQLLLEPDADISKLAKLTESYGAHLSRNISRIREDDRREHFITQRCFAVGRIEAKTRLQTLVGAIDLLPYPIVKIEEEFVVYDSNIELDAGW